VSDNQDRIVCFVLEAGQNCVEVFSDEGEFSVIIPIADLVRIVVDVPDSAKNRQWMKQFKARWKIRLEQIELWLVSYRIELD